MMIKHLTLPIQQPQPDAAAFIDHLMGRRSLAAPPLVEFIIDDEVLERVVTDLLGRKWVSYGQEHASQAAYLDNLIACWAGLGYDAVRFERGLDFPGSSISTVNTAGSSRQQRSWADEHQGPVQSWKDFEGYPFARVEDFDFFPFEYLASHLPEGMGLMVSHGGGVFEQVSWLFSIEKLYLALYDQPDLVQACVERVGELVLSFCRQLVDLPNQRPGEIFDPNVPLHEGRIIISC